MVAGFGTFPSNRIALVRDDGALDLYHGGMRALDPNGTPIFDRLPYTDYHKVLVEDVCSRSYMKFPFIKSLGPEVGWYRVGPLARVNVASRS